MWEGVQVLNNDTLMWRGNQNSWLPFGFPLNQPPPTRATSNKQELLKLGFGRGPFFSSRFYLYGFSLLGCWVLLVFRCSVSVLAIAACWVPRCSSAGCFSAGAGSRGADHAGPRAEGLRPGGGRLRAAEPDQVREARRGGGGAGGGHGPLRGGRVGGRGLGAVEVGW